MNSVEQSYMGFKGLLPTLFDQVLDGEREEKVYKMNEGGHIRVSLIDFSSEKYSPKVTSSGSLEVSYTAHAVQTFFKNVHLNDFFNVQSDRIKKALKATFFQIIKGTSEQKHVVGGVLEVSIKWDNTYGKTIVRVTYTPSEEKEMSAGGIKESSSRGGFEAGKAVVFEEESSDNEDVLGKEEFLETEEKQVPIAEELQSTIVGFLHTPNIFDYFALKK